MPFGSFEQPWLGVSLTFLPAVFLQHQFQWLFPMGRSLPVVMDRNDIETFPRHSEVFHTKMPKSCLSMPNSSFFLGQGAAAASASLGRGNDAEEGNV